MQNITHCIITKLELIKFRKWLILKFQEHCILKEQGVKLQQSTQMNFRYEFVSSFSYQEIFTERIQYTRQL